MSDLNDPRALIDRLADVKDGETVYLRDDESPRLDSNGQLAKFSRAEQRAVAEEYFGGDDRLHGDRPPTTVILNEKPIHRVMIYLHATGVSVGEIAKQTGYTYAAVSQVLRQPWARQRLTQILKEAGIDEVKHFLRTEVAPSLDVLREVRDTAPRPSDRAAAANAILDRALGKPTVHVESDNTNRNVPADVQRIESELAAVRKQLESSGHDGSVSIRN